MSNTLKFSVWCDMGHGFEKIAAFNVQRIAEQYADDAWRGNNKRFTYQARNGRKVVHDWMPDGLKHDAAPSDHHSNCRSITHGKNYQCNCK